MINLADFERIILLLQAGARSDRLNKAQQDFLAELSKIIGIIKADKNQNAGFSGLVRYISENQGLDIFKNIKDRYGIDAIGELRKLAEEFSPRVRITSPSSGSTIPLGQTIRFAVQIENLKIPRMGYKYRLLCLYREASMFSRRLKDGYYILAKGRTKENNFDIGIPASHKNLFFGGLPNRIQFVLYDVFSKREMRQRGLSSPHLISGIIEIRIVGEAASQAARRTYRDNKEAVQAIDSLAAELDSLAEGIRLLIEDFPKSRTLLERDLSLLDMYIKDLKEIKMPEFLNNDAIISRIKSQSEMPLFKLIEDSLNEGMEFPEIAAIIVNKAHQERDRIASNMQKVKNTYFRRKALKVGLELASAGVAAGLGIEFAKKQNLLKKLGIKKEEDLAEELKKIKIRIIKPKEKSVVGIGDYLRNFEAVAKGENKKLAQSINDDEGHRFNWSIREEEGQWHSIYHERYGSKSAAIPNLNIFNKSSGELLVAANFGYPIDIRDIIKIVLIKIDLDFTFDRERKILYPKFEIKDYSGEYGEYDVIPHIEGHGINVTWKSITAKPNIGVNYRLELSKEEGKVFPPGEYYLWLEVRPKNSVQFPVSSEILKLRIEEPVTMTDDELYLINRNVEYYVMPKGRLGDLAALNTEGCAGILSLLDRKDYDEAIKEMRKGNTQKKVCGVGIVLEYISMGNEEFKKGDIKRSKQLYQTAKELAIYVNEFNSSSFVSNYVAISLLLPVLNQPFTGYIKDQIKDSELVKKGSIYAPLFNSAKVKN